MATLSSRPGTDAAPAAPTSDAAPTHGEALRRSPAVAAAVRAIVDEVRAHSARLTDVRPPHPGLEQSYEALMARAADARGRGLLYPYVGSGLGHGALVELADGSVKWDMICGIGVNFFGHSDPGLVQAAVEAGLDDVQKHGNLLSNFDQHEFAEAIVREASRNSRLRHVYLSTSGCMANENALKVCYQKHAPASRVLAFRDCFMGRSVTMSQIGDAAANRQGIPLSTLVDYMPFWDDAAAAEVGQARFIDRAVRQLTEYADRYPGQHACFIFELVQGEGGFNTAKRDYLKALMDVCRDRRIAVWDDEIQTFGRLTRMFAYELYDLGEYVDVFCVGKMTQVCATLYTPEYNPRPGLLSGTFTGETTSFRTGRLVIDRLASGDFYGPQGRIARHHEAFRRQVEALAARRPEWFPPVAGLRGHAGGEGGMMRFTPFGGQKEAVVRACHKCFEEGVILFYCGHGPYHVRMLPPLGVMKQEDWPRVFACIERGLGAAAAEGRP